jgi:hypothetical protein
MSRIAFCMTGFLTNGSTPSLSPINGWFWLTPPVFAANTTGLPYISWPELFALAWNIQQITLTWDLVATPTNGNPPIPISGSQIIPIVDETTVIPLTDEQQLVTTLGTSLFQWNGPSPGLVFVFLPIAPLIDGTYPNITSGLSWSQLNIIFNTPDVSSLNSTTTGDPSSVTVTSATLPSLAGMTFTSAGGYAWSGTISIEATAYWPYASTASPAPPNPGPIYDATTGATLITPVPGGL